MYRKTLDKDDSSVTILNRFAMEGYMSDEFGRLPLASGASEVVGKLIVKLRDQGLLKAEDVNTILRTALIDVAPTANAAAE